MPRHAEAIAKVIYKDIYLVFNRFLPTHCWGKLIIFEIVSALPTYLATEFWRLSYWSANPFFQQIRINLH